MKKVFLSLLALSVYFISEAQIGQDTVLLIEKLFDRYKPGNPGCQLAISRNGQVVFFPCVGHGRPGTQRTPHDGIGD